MPPKKAAAADATSKSVYIVLDDSSAILSVHASKASAEDALPGDGSISTHSLIGGLITLSTETKKPAAKSKPVKTEAPPSPEAPKANTAAKKTKTPAEQRAANVDKPKKGAVSDKDLPDNVKRLLDGKGKALEGMAIIVTGVPPIMGRANAEKLVVLYGGKVSKSLSKNTSLVVIGNEAGPTKLEKIQDLGLKTVDEDGLVAMLEGAGGAGKKRPASDEDEDEEEEEESEEEVKPKKGKKQKK